MAVCSLKVMLVDAPTKISPLSRQATWVVGCRIVSILATLAANVLAARLLGPAEFGRYLFLFSVVVCGGLLGAGGLCDAVLRFTSESLALDRRSLAVAYTRRTMQLGVASTLIAAGVILAALCGFQFATDRLARPVLLLSLTVLALAALAWQQLASETLRAWNNLKLASLFSGGAAGGPLSTLLFLFGLIGLLAARVPVTAAEILGLLAASVCVSVPFALWSVWRMLHHNQSPHSDEAAIALTKGQTRQLLAMAGTVLAINLLAFFGEQLDIWIGKALLPPDQLGIYGVAKRSMLLTAMPVQMAMLAIIAAIPRLHAQQRRGELQDLMRGSAGLAAVPALGAIVLLVLFPEPILQFLFGGSYSGAAPLIRILAIGQAALVFVGNPSNVLYLTGSHRTALAVNLTAVAAITLCGPLSVVYFGVVGLAWTMSGALVLQYLLQWWFARQRTGVWTHVSLPKSALLNSITRRPRAAEASEATAGAGSSSSTIEIVRRFSQQSEAL